MDSFVGQESGDYEVMISNNSGHDAIVKIEDHLSGETYRHVFVRRGHTHTITGVRDGTFMIEFALGSDYSQSRTMFLKPISFTKLESG